MTHPERSPITVGDKAKGILYHLAGIAVYSQVFIVKRITNGEDGRIYWASNGQGWSDVVRPGVR